MSRLTALITHAVAAVAVFSEKNDPGSIEGMHLTDEPGIAFLDLKGGTRVVIAVSEIDHPFYQDRDPRKAGRCDYTYSNGEMCGLVQDIHRG